MPKKTVATEISICIACKRSEAIVATLNRIAEEYMRLCQEYVNLFCTQVAPQRFLSPMVIESALPKRWQQVAVAQAAYVAQPWHTARNTQLTVNNRRQELSNTQTQPSAFFNFEQNDGNDRNIPKLDQSLIWANNNVVKLEQATTTGGKNGEIDYWLTIATLEPTRTLKLPLVVPEQAKASIINKKLKSDTMLKRDPQGNWWLIMHFIPLGT